MEKSYSESYAAAGVDITAGYRSVELMKQYVARTMNEHCIGGLGGFGGLFELDCTDMPHPVLISGTDGVGTKLKIAFLMDKHDTVGIDCVAMCVNDVVCAGAKPLVFTAPFKKLLICQRELYAVGHSGCSQPCHPANSVVHLLVIPWYNAGIELIAKRCSVS